MSWIINSYRDTSLLDNMSKELVKKYDEIVKHWNLNTKILTSHSSFWKSSRFQSEMWFESKEQFVLKNLMRQNTELIFQEMRSWGPADHKKFYVERALGSDGRTLEAFKLDSSSTGTISAELSNTSDECREAFIHRWNDGYAFMEVAERVDLALQRWLTTQGENVTETIRRMQEAEKARDEVRDVLESASAAVSTEVASLKLRNLADNLGLVDFLEDSTD